MRMKLIATAVASLFAAGSAIAADDNFQWAGSLTVGGRATDSEGVNRDGAYGTSSTTVAPFTGPKDGAKANEYQNIDSAAIGVIDVRGGNSKYYFTLFGEELGRDDQFILLRGGGYDVFKAALYSDRMPHNLSWNALTPLMSAGTSFQFAPAGAYPPATNPATWNTFDYGLQRNVLGGSLEVNMKSPWFVRVDYNEVTTNGVRPSSGQLGTGSSNGLIEFGLPTDYKTKNTNIEAGYKGKNWNVKLAFLDSKFDDANQTAQWANFFMRSAMDTSLQPPDNDLKKWTLSGSLRDLPWDSTVLARFTQSKLTNSFDVMGGGLKGTSNAAPPTSVGYLITAPSSSTFEGDIKTTTASLALNSSPLAGLETRLYYEYYDKSNRSTPISYAAGGLPVPNTCTPTGGGSSASQYCMGPLTAPENFEYTKNEVGLEANYRITPKQKLYGGLSWQGIDRALDPAPKSDYTRAWVEYRLTNSSELTGRLKYQFLKRDSDLDPSYTNNSSNVQPTTVPYYFTAYDVSNFDQNMVKFTVDWAPAPLWSVGFGATWRQTDYKGNYYGRTDDTTQQYDLSVSWGDADKFRITGIANWAEVKFDQAYRNTASGASPFPGGDQTATTFDWGTTNTQDNWMVALLADWVPIDRLRLTASGSYQKTGGGVDFWSGNYAGAGGFNGGPLVNYVTDNTEMTRFQLKGEYVFNKHWSGTAAYWYEKYTYEDDQMRGYQGFYPYYQNLGGTNNSWNTGAFANPGYTNNIFYLTVTYKFDPPQVPAPLPKVAQAPAPAPVVAPPPPPPPAPAPVPAPAPAAPQVQKITLDAKVLFDFDKAVLKPEGKAAIDSMVVGKLKEVQKLEVVLVTGHTDRIGTVAYNQKLSERRADAVRDYLVSKGIDKAKIETVGMGPKQPVVQCDQKNLKDLIACLAPNRRVEVQVKGESTRR